MIHGQKLLCDRATNVLFSEPKAERTGCHLYRRMTCIRCDNYIGDYIERALYKDSAEKVGRYELSTKHIKLRSIKHSKEQLEEEDEDDDIRPIAGPIEIEDERLLIFDGAVQGAYASAHSRVRENLEQLQIYSDLERRGFN